MELFLVRHGKSIAKDLGRRQLPNDALSNLGIAQAQALANSLPRNFDRIISSPYQRAFQTAEIVAAPRKMEVEVDHLIREKNDPSSLVGVELNDEVSFFQRECIANRLDTNWRYQDEETIAEVGGRALNFKQELERCEVDRILVVSHDYFIRGFVGGIMVGDDVESRQYANACWSLFLDNTGISHFEYRDSDNRWRINSINDHSHLRNI